MIRANSKFAYRMNLTELSDRARGVYQFLLAADKPLTDREVQVGMGYHEPEMVKYQISDLVADKWVIEIGNKKCALTQDERRDLILKEQGHASDPIETAEETFRLEPQFST